MGKYMRKGKGVGKMEVSQGTLVGVRTRARSLALEKEKVVGSNLSLLQHNFSNSATTLSSSKAASGSSSHMHSTQPFYMKLRSRKLQKGIRSGKDKVIETFEMPELCKKASSSRLFLPLSRELHSFDKERCRLWLQTGSCSMQGSDSTSQSRLHPGSPRVPRPVAPTASSNHSLEHSIVSMAQKRPLGILTRNRRQELACCSAWNSDAVLEMDTVLTPQNAADSRSKRHIEVELCCGESPMAADVCNKDRDCGPSSTKRIRECTPDSFIRDAEAPGSTSKTRPSIQARASPGSTSKTRPSIQASGPLPAPVLVSCSKAPNANEIEAFLSSAEQRERRRFINRFNFDPLLERPLRGRYEWSNM